MAGNILTPSAIWNNFNISDTPVAKIQDSRKDGDVVIERVFIDGKQFEDGNVQIFGVLAKKRQEGVAPGILLLQDFDFGVDERLVKTLAKLGYTVLSIDLAGVKDGVELFTKYPKSISHANYSAVKDMLYSVENDVTDTCWYEWACAAKYALKYLQSLTNGKVGGFGLGEAATVLWQLAGTNCGLNCAVFALNAGWAGYRGIYKFGGMVEPQFSDNMYKFIAGIEPQAYAMHVGCPTLLLSATNSNLYDCDRAYDTISRIDAKVYSALHYSVGYRDRVSGEAFANAKLFFEEYLTDKKSHNLQSEVEISSEIVDGVVEFLVKPQDKKVESVYLYTAEETAEPAVRCWQRHSEAVQEKGVYKFSVQPYQQSGMITAFAQVKYKNGMVIGSNIVNKKFKKEQIKPSYKCNIIYSSRFVDGESVFEAENQVDENPPSINVIDKNRVLVKKGPMGIEGVTCEWGLLTFKIGADKFKPSETAILLFDVYAKEATTVTVKLIADYSGEKTEYLLKANLTGGNVWQNVKMELAKFKTAEGMALKSLNKIDALVFEVDCANYLINNALWV